MKLVFKRDGIEVSTVAEFPIIGEKEVREVIPYERIELNKPIIIKRIKPVTSSGVLVAIEMEVEEVKELGKEERKVGEAAPLYIEEKHPKAKKVGAVEGIINRKLYTIYETNDSFLIECVDRESHLVVRSVTKRLFGLVMNWIKDNVSAPIKLKELTEIVKRYTKCAEGTFWEIYMIARALGLMKARKEGNEVVVTWIAR